MVAKVLHVVERYLEVSAGFVHQHIANSRYDSLVVSRFTPTNTDAFPVTNLRSMPGWVTALPRPLADRALRAWVLKKATGAGVDIGHAHFGYALPYTRILKRRADIPVVLSLHGDDATAWAWANGWAFAPDPGLTAAVIVPSKWFVPFATKLGFAEERVHVIPSGVDTAFFTPLPMPTDGPPVVAFVGRLVEKKGVDVLMAAWPAVRAAVPDAQLHVLGEGPLATRLVGDGVTRIRPEATQRREQVRDLLRIATVVTTPSRTAANGDAESLLIVNLEAQASGRAVVTTRHGGIPEYVADGTSALVVPENDAPALADALISVLRDRALAERLGAAGPSLAAQWDARAMTARIDDLYDDLVR